MTDQHSSTVTESAHSPLPWQTFGMGDIMSKGLDGQYWLVKTNYEHAPPSHIAEREANAAFIVKAVNAHDALVNVVRDLVAAYDSGTLQMRSPEIGEPENGIPYHEWHEEWLHHARAALSQVRP